MCLPVYFRARIAELLSTFPQGERGDRNALTHPLKEPVALFHHCHPRVPPHKGHRQTSGEPEDHRRFPAAPATSSCGSSTHGTPAPKPRAPHPGPSIPGKWKTWDSPGPVDRRLPDSSAVFPGTSRSMSTIAARQVAGMSRGSLSSPSFLDANHGRRHRIRSPEVAPRQGRESHRRVGQSTLSGWVILAIGLIVSFLVAYASVAWFMARKICRKHGFVPFAVPRILAVWC